MNKNRRSFLKGAAAATLGVTALNEATAKTATERPMGSDRHRWAMVVDLAKCIGCQACTVACEMENAVPLGKFRTIVNNYEFESEGKVSNVVLPRLCNHCEQPPCIPVCPVQATYQRADGIVVVDNTRCVGCGYCVQACPYDARFINPKTQTADKCTFCVHRVEAGLLPACVETCVGGARIFGDLKDANSTVSKIIAKQETRGLQPQMNTKPHVYYVGLNTRFQSKVEGTPAVWQAEDIIEEDN